MPFQLLYDLRDGGLCKKWGGRIARIISSSRSLSATVMCQGFPFAWSLIIWNKNCVVIPSSRVCNPSTTKLEKNSRSNCSHGAVTFWWLSADSHFVYCFWVSRLCPHDELFSRIVSIWVAVINLRRRFIAFNTTNIACGGLYLILGLVS